VRRSGVAIVLTGLFVALSAAAYVYSCPLPKGSPGVTVYVEPGSSTARVADVLYQSGVIRSPLAFRALARVMRADGRIQSGEYRFEPGIFAWDAMRSLVQGRVVYYSLTVTEGLTVEETAEMVQERGFGDRDELLSLAKDRSLRPGFVTGDDLADVRYPLEGYLFPDTYYIRRGMTEKEIVSMMLRRSTQVFSKDVLDKIRAAKMTPHEAATLASIVEKEAYVPEERPSIAAVYLNRLRIGMKLDADPTVVYAIGQKAGYSLLFKDLETESPYNTYTHAGLPPGPIGNFGKASLDAVLNPANVDYLYFVAKKDGSHAFARTLSDHIVNVAKCQHD
jgi:UPF0755 protein